MNWARAGEVAAPRFRDMQASRSVLPPLPSNFTPVKLADISFVKLLPPGDGYSTRKGVGGRTLAQKSGLRYQQKVCDYLREFTAEGGGGREFLPGPWFEYGVGTGPSLARCRCQPDALLVSPGFVHVFEIKHTFTTDAWWQLCHLYEPVVQSMWPDKLPVLVNVVKSYMPEIEFPGDRWPLHFDFEWMMKPSRGAREAMVVQWRP